LKGFKQIETINGSEVVVTISRYFLISVMQQIHSLSFPAAS
jgi:hypothetical protein